MVIDAAFHIVFVFVMEIWNCLVAEIVIICKCNGNWVGMRTKIVPVQLSSPEFESTYDNVSNSLSATTQYFTYCIFC